jgi:hypothetical protein
MDNAVRAAVELLLKEGYLGTSKGKYCVMAKLNKAMSGIEQGLIKVQPGNVLVVREPLLPNKQIKWDELYMQFIRDAKVPVTLKNNHGQLYDCNKFSIPGLKAFEKALKGGTEYEMLVKSTMLYYMSGTGLKQAIGRYMSEGFWRTDYQALVDNLAQGTVNEHIENKIDNGQFTSYRF